MRKDNVLALLNHAADDLIGDALKNIEQQYTKALSEEKISMHLQIDVKNFMENLRSALDYIAHDVSDEIIKPSKKDKEVHFPYGKTYNDFKSGLGSNLPQLDKLNPSIFALIESVQPSKCSDDWLYQLCRIVNENKHETLTPQIKIETKTMTASGGGTSVTMPIDSPFLKIAGSVSGVIGKVPVQYNNQGIQPLRSGLNVTIKTWTSFQFADTNVQVLQLLKKALEQISILSSKIYTELERK